MKIPDPKIHSLALLHRTLFLCLGEPDLVALVNIAINLIQSRDFSQREEEARSQRLAFIGGGMRVELKNGESFIGKRVSDGPDGIIFLTPDGICDISALDLPEELQPCFPEDNGLRIKRAFDKIKASMEQMEERGEKAIAVLRKAKEIAEMAIEDNRQKQNEIDELRARLREYEG